MVIAPHPDESPRVGGTIARLTARARKFTSSFLPAARRRVSPRIWPRRSVGKWPMCTGYWRHAYTFLWLPGRRARPSSHADLNGRVVSLMQETSPDTIFIPFIGDVHSDHQLPSSRRCRRPPLHANAPRRILAYETLSETNWFAPGITPVFAPTVFNDISATLEIKLKPSRHTGRKLNRFPTSAPLTQSARSQNSGGRRFPGGRRGVRARAPVDNGTVDDALPQGSTAAEARGGSTHFVRTTVFARQYAAEVAQSLTSI